MIVQSQARAAWNSATRLGTPHSTNTFSGPPHNYKRDPKLGQRGLALGYLKYLRWSAYAISEQCRTQLGVDFRKEAGDGIEREMLVRQALRESFAVLVHYAQKKGKLRGDYKLVMNARGFEQGTFTTYHGFVEGVKSLEFARIARRMARTPAEATEAATTTWPDSDEELAPAPARAPPIIVPPPPKTQKVSNVVEMDDSEEDEPAPAAPPAPQPTPMTATGPAVILPAPAPPPAEKKRDERRRFPMFIPKVRVCSVPGPTAAQLEARERAQRPEHPPAYATDHEVLCSSGNWRQMQAPTGEGAVFASHLGVYFYNVRTQEQFWNLPQVYQDEDMEQLYQDEDPQPVPNAPFATGERAIVVASGKCGTVRFVGELPPFAGDWVGLEMDEPCGNCDGGAFSGVYYFWCMKDHGIYIRPNRLALAATVCDEGVAAVNRAAAKVAELDARVRAELAAEKEAENAAGPSADLAPMTDDDEPTPTGGPPAESLPTPAPTPGASAADYDQTPRGFDRDEGFDPTPEEIAAENAVNAAAERAASAPAPTPVPTPVPTPKITRSWQVPRASRSLVALQEKMNASPTTLNVLNYLFVKAKLLAGSSMLEYDSMGRAVLESPSSQWRICVKTRGRKPEDATDKLRKSVTKWDAYVVACGRAAAQRLREWQPKSYCNGSLRSEVQIKRFFESNPDFNEHLSIPA